MNPAAYTEELEKIAGWWRSGRDGELVGDGPADAFDDAIRTAAELYEESWGRPPTADELNSVAQFTLGGYRNRTEGTTKTAYAAPIAIGSAIGGAAGAGVGAFAGPREHRTRNMLIGALGGAMTGGGIGAGIGHSEAARAAAKKVRSAARDAGEARARDLEQSVARQQAELAAERAAWQAERAKTKTAMKTRRLVGLARSSKSPSVRQYLDQQLRKKMAGKKMGANAPRLLDLARNPDPDVREQAAELARTLGVPKMRTSRSMRAIESRNADDNWRAFNWRSRKSSDQLINPPLEGGPQDRALERRVKMTNMIYENPELLSRRLKLGKDKTAAEDGGDWKHGKGFAYQGPFPSTRKNKKMMVRVKMGGKTRTVHFGQKGYSDFTKHKDPKRRENYLKRSGGIRDGSGRLSRDNPLSANFWARRELW